ncbi:MAG: lysophospholipid acyltransferase family protein [Sphingomonadaceae bacterium]
MIWLRNLAFYVAFYLGSVFFTLTAFTARPFSQRLFKWAVHSWSRFHRVCVVNLLGCEIVIEGVMPDEPVFYAIKHESFFEAIDAPTLLRWPSIFAKQELFSIPAWGAAARSYGLIEVRRSAGAAALRTMLRAAKAVTAQGRPLVIFPEGTRVPHGEIRQLQSGFAGLYKMLGLPVLPIAVDSGPVYHRRLKRKGTITYRIGEVIEAGLPRPEIEERVLAAINALNRRESAISS